MGEIREITAERLNPEEFIAEKIAEIRSAVGDNLAITALSGGVDSSTVTILGHRALDKNLLIYFIDNGLMRQDEPRQVVEMFSQLGIQVEVIEAQQDFFDALKGLTDSEEKREAITQTFYKRVFGELVRKSGAKFLLQGTILTDVDETVAGIKRQHNVLAQLGIDTQKEFGYRVIEPLIQLRKNGVRIVAKALDLPNWNRMPFLGPALAGRIIGKVTTVRVEIVRQATAIVEEILLQNCPDIFQCMAILHSDCVPGMRDGKRDYGYQIEVRCWDSSDARTALPTQLSWGILGTLSARITKEVPGVVNVIYNITPKPPSTMEAV